MSSLAEYTDVVEEVKIALEAQAFSAQSQGKFFSGCEILIKFSQESISGRSFWIPAWDSRKNQNTV